MTPDDTARRLAEIRRNANSWDREILWLLDLVAQRDVRLAKLEAALREAGNNGDWYGAGAFTREALK